MQEEFEWPMMTLYMFINDIGSPNSNLPNRHEGCAVLSRFFANCIKRDPAGILRDLFFSF